LKLFVVTSPATDAGKTFIACNLAAAAASAGFRTTLLDYDLAVGDVVRALGLEEEARRPHPTVASWKDYGDLLGAVLRGPNGVAVFPRPENPLEGVGRGDVEALLRALTPLFDAAVADAGADVGAEHWEVLVGAADGVLLVVDCDEKAVYRTKRFLFQYGDHLWGKCWLVVNGKEPSPRYSARDVRRALGELASRFAGISEVPYDRKIAARGSLAVLDPRGAAARAIKDLAVELFGVRAEEGISSKSGVPLLRRLFGSRPGPRPKAAVGAAGAGPASASAGEDTGIPANTNTGRTALPPEPDAGIAGAAAGLEAAAGVGGGATGFVPQPEAPDPQTPDARPALVAAASTSDAEWGRTGAAPRRAIRGRVLLCLGAPRLEAWLADRLREHGLEAAVVGPGDLTATVRPGDTAVVGRSSAEDVAGLRGAGAVVVLVLGQATADEAARYDADRVVWWPKGASFRAEQLSETVVAVASGGPVGGATGSQKAVADEDKSTDSCGKVGVVRDVDATDLLTGCLTRRYLKEKGPEFPCSVVFIDLDGFKEVNDSMGHSAGDEVLAAFGRLLRENLGDAGAAVRWGGDEFVLLLPGVREEGARKAVERIRKAWEKDMPRAAAEAGVNFSVGVSWCRGPEELDAAIKRADDLMYRDKRARKERAHTDKTHTGGARRTASPGIRPDAVGLSQEEPAGAAAGYAGARPPNTGEQAGGVLVVAEQELAASLRGAGFRVVFDPRDARVCVSSIERVAYAPRDLPLLVVKRGSVSDMIALMLRPDAVLVAREDLPGAVASFLSRGVVVGPGVEATESSLPGTRADESVREGPRAVAVGPEGTAEEGQTDDRGADAVDTKELSIAASVPTAPEDGVPDGAENVRHSRKPNLYVLPGRGAAGGVAVPDHGAVYVVCPGEPPLAGHVAASIARQVQNCAVVCASGSSSAALALGMKPEDLVLCDWRIPGSDAPVRVGGMTVWPVDPSKFLEVKDAPVRGLVDQIRGKFPLVIVDCGGDLSLCTGLSRESAVVVVRAGGGYVEWLVSQWAKDHGGNVLTLGRGNDPVLERAGNGFVLKAGQAPGGLRSNKEA